MAPPFATTADAVARETAWLRAFGDSLPPLLTEAGGKWDAVQAYIPRTGGGGLRKNQIWVLRKSLRIERFGNVRKLAHYGFELICSWTLSSNLGNAEADQQAFDSAVDDVLVRIGGPLLDKTHGGAFLAVAEEPAAPMVDVAFVDPERTMTAAVFEARITYHAVDWDMNG